MPSNTTSWKYILALILIIALAVFFRFRFWQFTSIPPGLYQDEAMNGADALASLNSGEYKVFYTNNNGREGMIMWLDALAIKLFGTEPWVLRLFPAIAGVLAVLGLYFLAKELFGVEIALASSFFMATSFWAVNFSRIGFRAALMVPILIWSFYFLLRGFKRLIPGINRFGDKVGITRFYFIIAGILFGLGFYTYISYRFAPVLIAAFFIPYLIKYGNKKLWVGVSLFAVVTFIVALPIGLYFLNNLGDFFGRTSQVSIFSQNSPIKALAINTAKTLGMFNIAGDFNWRHNYAGSPELFLPVGLLFLLGIWLSVKRFAFENKFLLSWLAVFLLPNILATEGNPHALRALGAMPAAMIFSGIGLVWLYKKIQKYFDNKIENPDFVKYKNQLLRLKKEIFLFLIIFLIFVGAYDFNKYFTLWAFNSNVASAFSQSQVKIADYLNNLPKETEKYAIWDASDRATDTGLPVSAQTVYFLTTEKTKINYLKSDELNKIKPGKNGAVIAPLYFDLNLLHNLNKQFPQSRINFIHISTAVVVVP